MKASVPSHITGFFSATLRENPMKSGSVGCGMTLDLDATTTVEHADKTEIILNGELSDAPVSRYVVDMLSKSPVKVKTTLDMPLGFGFGASGAGALGCAYALDADFELGRTANQIASVAHVAEVIYRTGLGDVIAQNSGGLVLRLNAGAPGIAKIDRIPLPPTRIDFVVRRPMSTKEILSDPGIMKEINREGLASLRELLKKPTLRNFMNLSRQFTIRTGLATDWVLEAMDAVEAVGGLASMIMLGDAVFAISNSETHEALKEFGDVGTTYVSQKGANLD